MAEKIKMLHLRIPARTLDRLKEVAHDNLRSTQKQAIFVLNEYVRVIDDVVEKKSAGDNNGN